MADTLDPRQILFMTGAAAPPLDRPDGMGGDSSYLECPKLRWGIMGCGRVSHDFCLALSSLVPTAEIVACATQTDLPRSQIFADTFRIPKAYGSYESLVQDETVDIVYVGNVHSFRRHDGELCLLAGKHVLLEKPMACKLSDAQHLIALAREKKLFLMEGMWTRFFPAFETARNMIQTGDIGQIVNVSSDFLFDAADSEIYPSSYFYQRKLGGGASMLVSMYPLVTVLAMFGSRRPSVVRAVGQVDAPTEVDLQVAILLQFPPNDESSSSGGYYYNDTSSPTPAGAGIASLTYGFVGESREITTIVGTKGRITIESPCHCPTSLLVEKKATGRGQVASIERFEFPLPQPDHNNNNNNLTYHYPNSAGFCYEAAAVARCIELGCCPQFTQEESLICQEILEAVRAQLSLKTVDED
jgi:dihydrodiol dehydrogenase / D-xylose 1-dehydrogenase (NADP)